MPEPDGLQHMVAVSILAHVAILGVLLLAPGGWWPHTADEPKTVMTISLGGGGGGPQNGGMTTMGGRPVQAVRPPEEVEASGSGAAAGGEGAGDDSAAAEREAGQGGPGAEDRPGADRRAGAHTHEGRAGDGGQRRRRHRRARPGLRPLDGRRRRSGVVPRRRQLLLPRLPGHDARVDPEQLEPGGRRSPARRSSSSRSSGTGRSTDVALERSSGYTALDLTAQRAVYMTRQLPAAAGRVSELDADGSPQFPIQR